ncbi:hypothetical protein EKD04_007970 [Chloroflexales bacterium ZM16-3]|nr:hypothetical protein [Chloroflexales bacterium ZM16-3]
MVVRALRRLGRSPVVGLIFFVLVAVSVAGALALWQHEARRAQETQIGGPDDGDLVRGFYGREHSDYLGGRPFRWSMPERASLRFWAPPPSGDATLSLWMSVPDPAHSQTVTLTIGDWSVGPLPVSTAIRRYRLLLPARALGDTVVIIRSPRYPVADPRALGVVLWRARLAEVAESPLGGGLGEILAFPQLPLALLLLALALGRPGRRLAVIGALVVTALALVTLSQITGASLLLLASLFWHPVVVLLAAWLIVRLMAWIPHIFAASDLRAQTWLILAFATIALLTFSPAIYSDGNGYFAYVRSMVVDGDLSFANEYNTLWGGNPWPLSSVTGLAVNPWSIGPALIWMPLYGLAHAALRTLDTPWLADGFSLPYSFAATMTTALSALIFMLATYRACRRWASPGAAGMAVLTTFLGSTLWYYSMRLGSFAHALSAAATALFLLAWVRLEEEDLPSRWVVLGLVTGLMLLIYWACAVLLILPLITLLRYALADWRSGDWRRLAARASRLALAGLAATLSFAPQMLAWDVIYGSPLIKPDSTPSVVLQSHLIELLFAPYGLLIWTPAMFIGVCGLALLWRRDRWMVAGLMLSFGAYIFYNSIISDWHGSGAFGLRRLTSLVPWCALGLALIYERLLAAGQRILVVFSALAMSLWMLMQMIRYDFRYLPDRTPLGIGALSPGEFFLTRSLLPSWEIPAYIGTGSILEGLSAGGPERALAAAALIVLACAVAMALAYARRSALGGHVR